MSARFKLPGTPTLVLALLGSACGVTPAQAPADKPDAKAPPLRYVLTIAPYHKKIVGTRTTSFLLPAKNDESFGGPFDPRSGVFRVASDIYLGQNNSVNESTGEESIQEDRLAVLIAEFDPQGHLRPVTGERTTVGSAATDSQGRLSVVTTNGSKPRKAHVLGYWLTDFAAEPQQITPTLCSAQEMPTPANKKDSAYRYAAKTDPEQYTRGTFGCREWGFQLYDPKRPYIDVTSYLRTPWIHGFVGWSRTADNKPIIGLRRNTWLCLYDCPNGEAPGAIPDIAAWAKRNGWEPPQRPQKVPMFPDPTR